MEESTQHDVAAGTAGGEPGGVDEHISLVYHVARSLNRRLLGDVEFDELVSAGTLGLIEALEKFDPSMGHAFSTFAVPRIRGAILDELRRLDPAPRSIRQKIRRMEEAEDRLMRDLGRPPRQDELAVELDIDRDTLRRWKSEAERTVQVSVDAPAPDSESGATMQDAILTDEDAEGADLRVSREEEIEALKQEILLLDEQERTVLALYFFEELKLREIGEVLNLTVSRISQIRTQAIGKLRDRMAHLREA